MTKMDGATLTTFVDLNAHGSVAPSGMARHGDYLFVSDTVNSNIYAFSLQAETMGTLVDWLPTGLPGNTLAGLEVDALGRLYFVDRLGSRIVRISPKEADGAAAP